MVAVVLAARQPLRVFLGKIHTHRPVNGRPTRGMARPNNGIVSGQVSSCFFPWTRVRIGIVVVNVIALFGSVIRWMSPLTSRWVNPVCAMMDTGSVSRRIAHF